MDGNIVAQLFPGIASLMVQDTTIAIARIALIAFGFILAYLGFKRTLEPLIMVPILHNWLISCRLTSCNRFTT